MSDEKQHQLADIDIVGVDCKLTFDMTRTQTSDNHDSAGKQKLPEVEVVCPYSKIRQFYKQVDKSKQWAIPLFI